MKLTFKQFIMIPVGIAVLAFILMLLELVLKTVEFPYFMTWISFQAWAMYFMAGCTPQGGVKVVLGYLGGCLASMAIIALGVALLPSLGSMAFPLVVLVLVVPVISFERVPWFDFIPAWFVGAGVYFAIKGWGAPEMSYSAVAITTLVSCLVGQIFGVVTVVGRAKYEAMLAAKAATGGEAIAEATAPAAEAPADEAPAEDDA